MAQQQNSLLEGPVLVSLLKLAGPIVLANMLQAAYQLVDAFWVGRLGGYAVAAVSVSTPVVFLSMSLGMGFAMAGSILIAQYFGAGNTKNVSHIAAQTSSPGTTPSALRDSAYLVPSLRFGVIDHCGPSSTWPP